MASSDDTTGYYVSKTIKMKQYNCLDILTLRSAFGKGLRNVMYTLDILYIHHSFPFAIGTTNAATRKKNVFRHSTTTGTPHRDPTRPILIRFSCANAKLVSRNRP